MEIDYSVLKQQIRNWAEALGFQGCGVSHCDLSRHEEALQRWSTQGFHGEMDYMVRHGSKRSRPAELVPGTLSILSLRMDYLPTGAADSWSVIHDGSKGFISRYALGRDYHKVLRKRLSILAKQIEQAIGPFGHRVFVDSAPVLEKGIAQTAGIGWIGKHTNLIERQSGSWFFLGEIYVDLPLEPDPEAANHCGRCRACIDICPTQAIVAPYTVDARRCISYLTIELPGTIPPEYRKMIGNRIYGCDDCQLVCPWNRFAHPSAEQDFQIRHGLDAPRLISLFEWTEETFLQRMEGSPIRRLGHERWLRNIAVALANSSDRNAVSPLQQRLNHPSAMVRTHIEWAINELGKQPD